MFSNLDLTVEKLTCKVEKKDVEQKQIFDELKAVAEENEIEERVESVRRIMQRRMPNLRRNVKRNELKRIVEEKMKERNKKEFSKGKVAAKINQVWYLVSKKYEVLKGQDQQIKNILLEIEESINDVEKRSERKTNLDQDDRTFTEKIVELGVLLNQQIELIQDHNTEIDIAMEGLSTTSLTSEHSFSEVHAKVGELSKMIAFKDEILKEKYSKLETSVSELEAIQNEADEVRKNLEAAKKRPPLDQIERYFDKDPLDFVIDEKENKQKVQGTISDQLIRISQLIEELEKKEMKISELKRNHNDWTVKAHKCKCFFSGWFNKNCKF